MMHLPILGSGQATRMSLFSGASSAIPVFHSSLYRVCFYVGSASGCKHDQLPLFDLYTMQ